MNVLDKCQLFFDLLRLAPFIYISKPDCKFGSIIPFKLYTAVYLLDKGIHKLEPERICVLQVNLFGNTYSIIRYREFVLEAIFFQIIRTQSGNIIFRRKRSGFADVYLDFAFHSRRESVLQGI